jgi:hypothetical protein
MEVLGWLLLSIPAAIVFLLPWLFTAVCRWLTRNLVFRDGGTATFRGRGGEVFVWFYLALFAGGCSVGPHINFGPHIRLFSISLLRWDYTGWNFDAWEHPWRAGAVIAAVILLWMIGVLGQLHVTRWCIAKTELSTGEQFEFHGAWSELAGWQVINGLAALTIIGWAWTTAAAYRWAARNTRSEERGLRFHGAGFEILWRTLATALFCIPIVTIPWALLWYARWLVSQLTIGSAEILD